jgi:hypothetical protein
MYDFYGNPPKTREDIREYLTSWLQNTNDNKTYTLKGVTYIIEKSFRRAFNIHSVFKNTDTNRYHWYVFEDTADTFSDFPQESYDTYESLIENVIEYYYKLWRLDKNSE